jgi:hypothetical protein
MGTAAMNAILSRFAFRVTVVIACDDEIIPLQERIETVTV